MASNVAELPVHDRLMAWFETRKRPVLWASGAVVVAGVVIGFMIWHRGARQTSASEALSKVTSRGVTPPGASDAPQALLKVAAEYPDTAAAGRALLLAGAGLFTEGKYAEAKAQFERYLRAYAESPFTGQALLGVATCLDLQGKTNEAIAAYNDIIQHHPMDNVVPPAKFALAQLYEKQNKLRLASDLFEELARPGAFNSLSTLAAGELQKLITQHPQLEPPRPPLTNLPALNPSASP